jgi:hypothetical protein
LMLDADLTGRKVSSTSTTYENAVKVKRQFCGS